MGWIVFFFVLLVDMRSIGISDLGIWYVNFVVLFEKFGEGMYFIRYGGLIVN